MRRNRHFLKSALFLVSAVIAGGGIAAGVSAPAAPSDTEGAATAPFQPGRVAGRVTNADPNAKLGGVAVYLVREGRMVDRTMTNADGKFFFVHVRPGRFVVAAEKRGLGTGRQPAEVKPGEVIRVAIELKKPS